ncbi:GAF domain-containing protein [Longimicrobium terrae]|uniref:Putative methionine-R-sulfoxide reductase with GAF domain n=1 Tax=Longimicrobium terrae TaxID=1639882 RepID=A0A841H5G0_9BACT|nr:GAF domain-containing protein [Longimicrobium terrae]MBB4638969.1 putative methionine-R-sulfoxide reductase with GAF domain [Longimicrobium terrae]MBB6073208.1 putative methionine-R-sulfoxide reductase with GAF domain [Longimicrobium terrae]NNC32339.1 GAF domain-containing protein [Longimicrobium terrae]
MFFPVRLHDAVDTETVLRRLLPVLAGARERRVAYAAFNAGRGLLDQRWTVLDSGEVEVAPLELEPSRLHSLLMDDVGGDRPLRPAESVAVWVLRDLLPGIDPDKSWVRVRAIAHDGALLGALIVAEPRRFSFSRKTEGPVPAAGDVLEMALARALALRAAGPALGGEKPVSLAESVLERLRESERAVAEARAEMERSRGRIEALERAASGATELLMDAHVDLDRRAAKHQRQTRVMFLLRKLMERNAAGMEPRELAVEIVRTVAEAFGGGRCSLMLVDETGDNRELRLGAAIGLPPELVADGVRIPMGSGVSGRVARTRLPLVVRDPHDSGDAALMGDDWYTSDAFVSLPLVSRGRLLGVLNLTNFRAGTVDDTEVEQLRLVSLCVGLLADHAGLPERLFLPA